MSVDKVSPIGDDGFGTTHQPKEVYCLKWAPTGVIAAKECYADIERAQKRVVYVNKKLPWRHKIFGHQWVLTTLKIKE